MTRTPHGKEEEEEEEKRTELREKLQEYEGKTKMMSQN